MLVVVNSLLPVPAIVRHAGSNASRFFLVASIAALGMKTSIKDIASVGWKPVMLMIGETIFIAAIVLFAITLHWV